MPGQPCVVANTDFRWFQYLQSISRDGRIDEVNFWRPMGTAFKALTPGGPFFLRLKQPHNVIAGYGYFAAFTSLPIRQAWVTFEQHNGDPSLDAFARRIGEYRHESLPETPSGNRPVGCIVLREVRFLSEEQWIPWRGAEEWQANIVAYKSYDLAVGAGRLLAEILKNDVPDDLLPNFRLILKDERERTEQMIALREGQGAFRVRVLDAYGRRCAVTGERSLPVLDAAHIQDYLGPASNHVQNGISLRADIHRLYDSGYVTVTPDLRLEVSRRLREDYENGRDYYELAGRRLVVLPNKADLRPSREALGWHTENVFRG